MKLHFPTKLTRFWLKRWCFRCKTTQIRNQRKKPHRTVHLTEVSGVFHFSRKLRPWYPSGSSQKMNSSENLLNPSAEHFSRLFLHSWCRLGRFRNMSALYIEIIFRHKPEGYHGWSSRDKWNTPLTSVRCTVRCCFLCWFRIWIVIQFKYSFFSQNRVGFEAK